VERQTLIPVGGRLSNFLNAWAEVTDDEWVLSTVSGYELPFHSYPDKNLNPPPHIIKPGQEDIINEEIIRLLKNNAIEETNDVFYLNQIFLVPKPHGGWRPVVNLKPLNQYLLVEHFKMENLNMVSDSIQQAWWMAKLDLKDAYLTVNVIERHRKYLQFEWRGKHYQFRSLPFGLATAPFAFTKLTKPVVAHLRIRGMTVIIYIDDILILAPTESKARECVTFIVELIQRLGFVLNLERSITIPVQVIEFLGFEINSIELTWSIPIHKKQKIKTCAESIIQGTATTARQLSRVLGLITSAVRGYQSATLHIRQSQMCLIENLKISRNWDQNIQLSDQARLELQWWIQNVENLPGSPIFHDPHELVIETDASGQGWGARCGHLTTGGVWSHEEKLVHSHINPLELMAAFLAVQFFLQRPKWLHGVDKNRQYKCNDLLKQTWRDKIQEIKQCRITNVGLVSEPEHLGEGGASARKIESLGGLGIPECTRPQRLEITPGFSPATVSASSVQCGPICQSAESSAPKLLELETGSEGPRNECVSTGLEVMSGICIPAILPCGEVRPTMHPAESKTANRSTTLEKSVLVSVTPEQSFQSPNSDSTSTESPSKPREREPSVMSAEFLSSGGLANIGGQIGSRSISEGAMSIIGNSIRPSTKSAYKSAWSSYVRWCGARNVDPFQESVSNVLDYLTFLLKDRGLTYRSLNLHRSAISFHIPCDPSLGARPEVNKFMKGAFNLKPPQPRYTEVWDVSVLVEFLSSLPAAHELSLKELSMKLVTLMALTNADRASDIQALDIKGLSYSPEGAVFKKVHLTKTSRPGHMPDSFYASYEEDMKLCVVTHLKEYISRTTTFRQTSSLILSHIKPHGRASSPTISRWMLSMMSRAGIDTQRYKSHSTRAASTTKATERGLTFDQLQKCANWTNQSTFQKFYYRPRQHSTFARAVLNSGNLRTIVNL